jgi:RNA polymerase sigma-70 factor (ECF subfamily)
MYDMSEKTRYNDFLMLFVPAQVTLRRYVLAHIPDFHEAEDVLQDVSLVLWNKFDQYDRTRRFDSWAFGITHRTVLRRIRDRGRRRTVLSPEVCSMVGRQLIDDVPVMNDRRSFLKSCLEELPGTQRRIVQMKYTERASLKRIAEQVGKSANAVAILLCRIRGALARCIERKAEDMNPAVEPAQ